MDISIDLIKNHPNTAPKLMQIWRELIGNVWMSSIPLSQIQLWFKEWCENENLPIAYIALDGKNPIGMCSLELEDGIRQDLTPWLGSLCVDPTYQSQGIGSKLMNVVKTKAKDLGFNKIYLYTFDESLLKYYKKFGWQYKASEESLNKPVIVLESPL